MQSSTAVTRSRQYNDRCACTCYPNGIVVVILAQILLLTALILSAGTMIDCKFVIADIGTIDPSPPSELVGLVGEDRRGLGFFIHEESNGECRWEYWADDDTKGQEKEDEIADYIEDYVDWLGSDWETARGLGMTALVVGALVFIWALVFSCVAHPKPLRFALGALSILIVMTFQFSTFAVLNSDFCDERNCKIGRSGSFCITAGVLYFIGGALFFFSKNYSTSQRVTHVERDEVTTAKQEDLSVVAVKADQKRSNTHNDEERPVVVEGIVSRNDGISGTHEVKPETAVIY